MKTARKAQLAATGVAALVVAGTGCLEPGANTLTGVSMARTGTNTDTVTFTFFDVLPRDAHATYTGTTAPTEPPGEIDGKTYVLVTLHSAQAHDQRNHLTSQHSVYAKNMASIAETELSQDFEGYLQYTITRSALARRTRRGSPSRGAETRSGSQSRRRESGLAGQGK